MKPLEDLAVHDDTDFPFQATPGDVAETVRAKRPELLPCKGPVA
jgi:hypothetical protein